MLLRIDHLAETTVIYCRLGKETLLIASGYAS
jgi:hypothetical protein